MGRNMADVVCARRLRRVWHWCVDRHAIIGTIVVAILILLPVGGYIGHHMYKSRGRNLMGLAHAWGARFAIILGIINGGLGINLAGEDSKFWIPYTVIAVVVCAV